MRDVTLRQDNRLTNARYELTLVEKRVLYIIIKQIRKDFVLNHNGQRNLFDNLVIKMRGSQVTKDLDLKPHHIKEALKQLRQRSFEWQNEYDEEDPRHEWFEVGFINYGDWTTTGLIEVEVSKKILPFFVELADKFTEYSALVAISLRSKWSQRFYELCCQWRVAGGFQLEVSKLREMLMLEDSYKRYASLKKYVIEVARKELQELYDKGQSDVCFAYSELKNGRSVDALKFKVLTSKDKETLSLDDMDYYVRVHLHNMFETEKKPKNKEFIDKTMVHLRLNPDDLKHCYKRLFDTVLKLPKAEQGKYMRYIIQNDYLEKGK